MLGKIQAYIWLARPHQFVKNIFVLLPIFFGHKLADPGALLNGLYAFLAFCFTSAAIYVINDLLDINEDRLHPVKRNRPLASGTILPRNAHLFSFLLAMAALFFSFLVDSGQFRLVLLSYFILNILYCTALKKIALVDICCIGIGFVLRVVAGAAAIQVPLSHWIVMVTFLLALFLALAKRRDDVLLANDEGRMVRSNIGRYNLEFISGAMVLMASVTVVSYIMYTVSPGVIMQHGSDKIYLTGFWVILGFLRYLQVTFVENRSGSPTMVLLKDYFLQLVLFCWLGTFFILIYAGR